jgi:hypothetical protein
MAWQYLFFTDSNLLMAWMMRFSTAGVYFTCIRILAMRQEYGSSSPKPKCWGFPIEAALEDFIDLQKRVGQARNKMLTF